MQVFRVHTIKGTYHVRCTLSRLKQAEREYHALCKARNVPLRERHFAYTPIQFASVMNLATHVPEHG